MVERFPNSEIQEIHELKENSETKILRKANPLGSMSEHAGL